MRRTGQEAQPARPRPHKENTPMTLSDNASVGSGAQAWSRRKKDRDAPRGVFRHSSGVWAIRYACSAGCSKHEECVGPLKSDAIRVYHERRARAHAEPRWCPAVERRRARERAREERSKQRARISFEQYARDYLNMVRDGASGSADGEV